MGELLALFDAVRGAARATVVCRRGRGWCVDHGSGDAGDPAHPGCGCDLPRDRQERLPPAGEPTAAAGLPGGQAGQGHPSADGAWKTSCSI
jgi:hypothetical protein